MTVEVKVPTLPESVPDATLLDWRKKVGDAVAQDEILVELETDKVVLEVPAPQAGVLSEIVMNTGDTAVASDILARIDTDAAVSPGAAADAKDSAPAVRDAGEPSADEAPAHALSPAVRKLVEEHALDASKIQGTGKGGRLTKGDVLAFIDQATSAEPAQAPPPAASAAAPAPSAPAPDEPRSQLERLGDSSFAIAR